METSIERVDKLKQNNLTLPLDIPTYVVIDITTKDGSAKNRKVIEKVSLKLA
jgi:hypothetical protein